MHHNFKLRSLGLMAGGLLLLAACHERNPDNPDPKYPPLKITITSPKGWLQGDSAWIASVRRSDSIPDTTHMPPRTTKKADTRRFH